MHEPAMARAACLSLPTKPTLCFCGQHQMGLGWQHVAGSFGAGALAAAGLSALVRRAPAPATALDAAAHAAVGTEAVRQFLLHVAPNLDGTAHKGQAGRVGVLGGSKDYTGAPYYSGQAALSVGADLLYLFTAEEACNPIKSYSPELMVSRRHVGSLICRCHSSSQWRVRRAAEHLAAGRAGNACLQRQMAGRRAGWCRGHGCIGCLHAAAATLPGHRPWARARRCCPRRRGPDHHGGARTWLANGH